MAHHEQNVALLQRIKGCTLWKNTADKFMCNLTAPLLVGALRIAIENSAPYLTELSTLNGHRIGKFAAPVRQDNWEQTAILFVPKGLIQPFKNFCDRPCRIPISQKRQHEVRVSEEYGQQHFASFAPLYRVNLHDGNIREDKTADYERTDNFSETGLLRLKRT